MIEDPDRCYRAVASRDERFDGWFYLGVTSTGIYCRPSCPARTPKPENLRYFRSAAAAHQAGFRSCKRCRPDATPGSPEWDARADTAARAMRLIADGALDRDGVPALAARLGYSPRQLQRLLTEEVGAGPLALARAQRAHTARVLCETTDLGLADIAFAAGFGSVRQFNETVRAVYDRSPSQLRAAARTRRAGTGAGAGPRSPAADRGETITLRLAHREPLAVGPLLHYLTTRAVRGVEAAVRDDEGQLVAYRRTLSLPGAPATVTLRPQPGHVEARLRLGDLRDLGAAVARLRRLLDLDADPVAVDATLAEDPWLRGLVLARPGLRVPGAVDGWEIAVRAVVGQQISVAGAVTVIGRLAEAHGAPAPGDDPKLTRLFPTAEAIAALDPSDLPMPAARARALIGLAAATAAGDVDLSPGADRTEAWDRLVALPGIGPWTASYIALRALADPDAFLPTDLGVRQAAGRLGLPDTSPAALTRHAERWRPWRAHATLHLWSSLS